MSRDSPSAASESRSAERRQIDELLRRALRADPEERTGLLDRECPPELRGRLERLLAAMEDDQETAEDPLFRGVNLDEIGSRPPGDRGSGFAESASGRHIGSYRIVEKLGSGGMGVVYLAERSDGQYDQKVAVKLARSAALLTDDLLLRFRTERQILAGLEHPSIARLLDGGVTEAGLPYFVMEWVDGVPIDEYCDQERLSIEDRLRLFLDVASAVEAAHRKLVVHRDLKPSNILVTRDGQAKLLDFGIAKPLDRSLFETQGLAQTRDAMSVMTPGYASPEQFRGEVISTASDVYQLGLLLYLLLTGERPYRVAGQPLHAVLAMICDEPVTAPSLRLGERLGGDDDPARAARESAERRRLDGPRLQRTLAGDLDTIVLKALRKEPERRYPSPAALADDVRRYLEGRPVLARGESKIYRLRKLLGRHRGVVAAVLVGTLLAVGLGGWALSERRGAERRAALSRSLGEELKDMEWRLRVAQMSPLHSIEGEMDRIRRRLDHLRDLTESLGEPAVGPGSYAIGRGLLLLGEPRRAAEPLAAAREAGYRTPDSAAALALAHGEIYLEEKDRLQQITDPEQRRREEEELRRRHRDPALALLTEAADSTLVPDAYLEARRASLADDTERALESAARATEEVPWLFEAHLLRASLLRLQGIELFYSRDSNGEDLRKVEAAARAYRDAARVAASAADAHAGRCDMAGLAIHIALHDEVSDPERFRDMYEDSCAKAVTVTPSDARAWRLFADAESSWAGYRFEALGQGVDFDRARELIGRALELAPDDFEVIMSAGNIYAHAAHYLRESAGDPEPEMELALAFFERCMELRPNSGAALNQLGGLLRTQARYRLGRGLDAHEPAARSVELFLQSLALEPRGIDLTNLKSSLALRIEVLRAAGEDPRPEIERVLGRVEALPEMPRRRETLETLRAWAGQD